MRARAAKKHSLDQYSKAAALADRREKLIENPGVEAVSLDHELRDLRFAEAEAKIKFEADAAAVKDAEKAFDEAEARSD